MFELQSSNTFVVHTTLYGVCLLLMRALAWLPFRIERMLKNASVCWNERKQFHAAAHGDSRLPLTSYGSIAHLVGKNIFVLDSKLKVLCWICDRCVGMSLSDCIPAECVDIFRQLEKRCQELDSIGEPFMRCLAIRARNCFACRIWRRWNSK